MGPSLLLTESAFERNSIVFNSRMPQYLIQKTFDQYIQPVLTDGCKLWTLQKELSPKFKSAQRALYRCMLGIPINERKRNERMRWKTKETDIVHRFKSYWAGHLARRTNNRWSTTTSLWYTWDTKRTKRRLDIKWDYDIGWLFKFFIFQ